ncbi:MAG: transposase [Bdellovibrionales bacterium]|nr:transposase [Bdellovibrionales bacterium]
MCPNARICIDRFHLAEYVNNVFDDVRKMRVPKGQGKTKMGFKWICLLLTGGLYS